MDDCDVSDQSGGCFEFPRVFAAVRTTNPDVGEVAHKVRYDSVVVATDHRLEASLCVRIESRPLVLGEDSSS